MIASEKERKKSVRGWTEQERERGAFVSERREEGVSGGASNRKAGGQRADRRASKASKQARRFLKRVAEEAYLN